MLELLRSLVEAATSFMQHQANPSNFEFLGLDIITDSAGGVWLMEGDRMSRGLASLFAYHARPRRCSVWGSFTDVKVEVKIEVKVEAAAE